jgi:hypothetical protein
MLFERGGDEARHYNMDRQWPIDARPLRNSSKGLDHQYMALAVRTWSKTPEALSESRLLNCCEGFRMVIASCTKSPLPKLHEQLPITVCNNFTNLRSKGNEQFWYIPILFEELLYT